MSVICCLISERNIGCMGDGTRGKVRQAQGLNRWKDIEKLTEGKKNRLE